jgi:hypothetical protein
MPIVPARSDYDDGEFGVMISRGNRSKSKKVKISLLQAMEAHRVARG